MTRPLWVLAWAGVAVWSLLAFGAYGLVDLFGGLIARSADGLTGDPGAAAWLAWLLNGLKNLGLTVILLVWGLVSLTILAVPWVLDRLVGRTAGPRPPRDPHVIDLTPDQYRHEPTSSRPGSVSRIEPRR